MNNNLLTQKELISDDDRCDRNPFKSNSFQIKTPNHLEEILNTMTFKLKTQLSNISLASELLETSLLSTEQQMFVAIIQRGSECLRDLISDIKMTALKYGAQPESLPQASFSSY